jgi:hypothetical protein
VQGNDGYLYLFIDAQALFFGKRCKPVQGLKPFSGFEAIFEA